MDSKEARERMESGRIYLPGDEDIMKEQALCLEKLYDFNSTRPLEMDKRNAMLKDMFARVGQGCYFEPPLHANFGGKHVYLGNYVYGNFNLTLVDDGDIFIDDNVMIGPNVTIATAGHPVQPELRRQGMQFNISVHICKNVWIGAGSVVLPGITIGENSVIGAGSIVTKDIPANVVAVGNPCKILREINDRDKEFYFKDRKIDL